MKIVGKKVAIVSIVSMVGNDPTEYDLKYTVKAMDRVVTIVDYDEENDLYLTDFFIKEYIKENNDYIHYGFLKIERYNFKLLY